MIWLFYLFALLEDFYFDAVIDLYKWREVSQARTTTSTSWTDQCCGKCVVLFQHLLESATVRITTGKLGSFHGPSNR